MKKDYEARWGHSRKPSRGIAKADRERKREEADARDAKYKAMSIKQRIALARSRRGASKSEIDRLEDVT